MISFGDVWNFLFGLSIPWLTALFYHQILFFSIRKQSFSYLCRVSNIELPLRVLFIVPGYPYGWEAQHPFLCQFGWWPIFVSFQIDKLSHMFVREKTKLLTKSFSVYLGQIKLFSLEVTNIVVSRWYAIIELRQKSFQIPFQSKCAVVECKTSFNPIGLLFVISSGRRPSNWWLVCLNWSQMIKLLNCEPENVYFVSFLVFSKASLQW